MLPELKSSVIDPTLKKRRTDDKEHKLRCPSTSTANTETEEQNHHKKQAKQRKKILSLHTNTETVHPINTAKSSFSNVKRHETVHPNTQSHETDKNKFKILSLHTETFV